MESPHEAVRWMARKLRGVQAAQLVPSTEALQKINHLEQMILEALPEEPAPAPLDGPGIGPGQRHG